MAITEANTLTELVRDCAYIPPALQRANPPVPAPRVEEWAVSESCLAQVQELDPYGA